MFLLPRLPDLEANCSLRKYDILLDTRPDGGPLHGHGFLFLWICDLGREDLPVKGERCLVEIVERYGRAEVAADVEAVVGGEAERGGDRHKIGRASCRERVQS